MVENSFPFTVHFRYQLSKFEIDVRYIDEELGLEFFEITSSVEYLGQQYPGFYYELVKNLLNHPYFITMGLYIRKEKLYLREIRTYESMEKYTSSYCVDVSPNIFPKSSLYSLTLPIQNEILEKTPADENLAKDYLIKLALAINDFYDQKENQASMKKIFFSYNEYFEGNPKKSPYFTETDKIWQKFASYLAETMKS